MTDSSWGAWVGRSQDTEDIVSPTAIRLMRAALGSSDEQNDELPPLWHWLHFLQAEAPENLSNDGHPCRGGFLPPIELPRRMWAGGALTFHHPLRVGEFVRRVSRISNIQEKTGRTGSLVFVQVAHEIHSPLGLAISESQDIVYREAPGAVQGLPLRSAPHDAQFSRIVTPDPILLFRYSALTFNGHRIHYDHPYATQIEGYPSLVVHGPLIATLLLEQLRAFRPGVKIRNFTFRALSPLFVGSSFTVAGRVDAQTARLWAAGADGQFAMDGMAILG
ncbi:FAS1-like dehydratase domain-containing protein [Variovorax sp. VNK109]|uniref:FAS1-like dehydratase domain-containing protein n=1 Tax=Variovorax sp. VNK109 TaxID=3400919 RepID=UPI003C01B8F7